MKIKMLEFPFNPMGVSTKLFGPVVLSEISDKERVVINSWVFDGTIDHWKPIVEAHNNACIADESQSDQLEVGRVKQSLSDPWEGWKVKPGDWVICHWLGSTPIQGVAYGNRIRFSSECWDRDEIESLLNKGSEAGITILTPEEVEAHQKAQMYPVAWPGDFVFIGENVRRFSAAEIGDGSLTLFGEFGVYPQAEIKDRLDSGEWTLLIPGKRDK